MSNILSGIPKPLLKKAEQIVQEAIRESEMKEETRRAEKSSLTPNSMTKVTYRDLISLNEIISWAKAHYPDGDGIKFIVIKEKSDNLEYDFILYLLFMKDDKPLLDGNYQSMAVYSKKMDDSLYETFNNSDIIEFE